MGEVTFSTAVMLADQTHTQRPAARTPSYIPASVRAVMQRMTTASTAPPRAPGALQQGAINLVAMGSAVAVFQPALALKFLMQSTVTQQGTQSGPRTNPLRLLYNNGGLQLVAKTLYKGVGANMVNAPVYATMGLVKGAVTKWRSNNGQRQLTVVEKVGLAAFSAAVGAVPCSVADMVMIRKVEIYKDTKQNVSVMDVLKPVVRKHGLKGLTRGMGMTLGREVPGGIFLLYVAPSVEAAVSSYLPNWLGWSKPAVSVVLSAFAAGLPAAALTQMPDVIKSVLQKDCMVEKYPRARDAARAVYQAGSLAALQARQEQTSGHWVNRPWAVRLNLRQVAVLGGVQGLNAALVPRTGAFVLATGTIVTVNKLAMVTIVALNNLLGVLNKQ